MLHRESLRRTKNTKFTAEIRFCHPEQSEESLITFATDRCNEPGCFAALNMTDTERYKKNREGNKFSSRVEVRVVTPKKFGALTQRWA
jgi:hypothetical protein